MHIFFLIKMEKVQKGFFELFAFIQFFSAI